MTAPHTPAAEFSSALIVTSSEGHAKIDREFLKNARIMNTTQVASGTEALAELRRKAEGM